MQGADENGGGPSTATIKRSLWVRAVASAAVVAGTAVAISWWRTPPALPVVESITQLTDDSQPKANLVTDGSRIYFNEGLPSDS